MSIVFTSNATAIVEVGQAGNDPGRPGGPWGGLSWGGLKGS